MGTGIEGRGEELDETEGMKIQEVERLTKNKVMVMLICEFETLRSLEMVSSEGSGRTSAHRCSQLLHL